MSDCGGGRLKSGAGAYLVETVADAAQLRRELAGGAHDGLEEALGDLPQVLLVLLQVLALFQPGESDKVHHAKCNSC